MKDFFRRNGIWVVVAALLLTAALSLGSALFPNLTSPLSNVIGIVASPFQKATTSFTGWVESLYDYAFRYQELQSKVEELELQISEMNKDNREAEDAVAENARLRKLLKLAEKHTDQLGVHHHPEQGLLQRHRKKRHRHHRNRLPGGRGGGAGLQLVYRHHPGGPGHLHGRPGLPDR